MPRHVAVDVRDRHKIVVKRDKVQTLPDRGMALMMDEIESKEALISKC